MKLEELISMTTLEKNAMVYDCYGQLVAISDAINSIPPFLNNVEVDSIRVCEGGSMDITLKYEDRLSPAQHIEGLLTELDEAVADDYRISSPEDVNNEVLKYMEKIHYDSKHICMALSAGEEWDKYLD